MVSVMRLVCVVYYIHCRPKGVTVRHVARDGVMKVVRQDGRLSRLRFLPALTFTRRAQASVRV